MLEGGDWERHDGSSRPQALILLSPSQSIGKAGSRNKGGKLRGCFSEEEAHTSAQREGNLQAGEGSEEPCSHPQDPPQASRVEQFQPQPP